MKLTIIVPCFNESKNIEHLFSRLQKVLTKCQSVVHWDVYFVNDGSSDGTVDVIKRLMAKYENVFLLNLSKNYGHQTALRAGFDNINIDIDAAITMDADLQHPPELIPEMVKQWENGYDIVYTVRLQTESEGVIKKLTSKIFYWIFSKFSAVEMKPGVADYRLYDKTVVKALRKYNESAYFLRGLISSLGFSQTYIDYKAAKRYAGNSKYTFKKMLHLAKDGMLSFSNKPLRMATSMGIFFAVLSLFFAGYTIMIWAMDNSVVPGWSSISAGIFFIGGLNLIFLGIIGEYLGMVFTEVKRRPNYHLIQDRVRDKR